jgi:hypothetical protein
MTKLGKIVKSIAPQFVDRMIYLDKLSNKIVFDTVMLRRIDANTAMSSKPKTTFIDRLNTNIAEFNTNKFWFMRKK